MENVIFLEKNVSSTCAVAEVAIPLHSQNGNNGSSESQKTLPGRLAQLVQSVCLTSRMSAVRIRYRP